MVILLRNTPSSKISFFKELSSHPLSPYLFSKETQISFPLFSLFQENTLIPIISPENINYQTLATIDQSNEIQLKKYIVKKGDTIWSIAKEFGIDVNTILWANNLSEKAVLKEGDELLILPVSGVLHLVSKGDTIESLAKMYKVRPETIIEFNNLEDDKILAGDILIIPGGKKPESKNKSRTISVADSYFILPLPLPCKITQGLHWYNAVDFSNGRCSDPVYAVAGGTVQKTGYSSLAGYFVRILHPNGVVTFYGHLSRIVVSPGQEVSQGQVIGYVGHTGYTIPRGPEGCHLHFDVFGGQNPFAK